MGWHGPTKASNTVYNIPDICSYTLGFEQHIAMETLFNPNWLGNGVSFPPKLLNK
jgi:hypothetical protein